MFGDCINLTSLDLSGFDMGNATMGDLIIIDGGMIVGEGGTIRWPLQRGNPAPGFS